MTKYPLKAKGKEPNASLHLLSDGFPYQSKDETHGNWSQFEFLENLSW